MMRFKYIAAVGNLSYGYTFYHLAHALWREGPTCHGMCVTAGPEALVTRLRALPEDSLTVADRGGFLPTAVVKSLPGRKLYYSPEILPREGGTNEHAEQRFVEFSQCAPGYDGVILHDGVSKSWLEAKGFNVVGVVPLGINPAKFRLLGYRERSIDVMVSGLLSQRRLDIVQKLRDSGLQVFVSQAWGAEYVHHLNLAKVVLNLHYTELANCELRIAEALACGAAVVTEPLQSEQSGLVGGHHLLTADTPEHMISGIKSLLGSPALRERMANAGRIKVLATRTIHSMARGIIACAEGLPQE